MAQICPLSSPQLHVYKSSILYFTLITTHTSNLKYHSRGAWKSWLRDQHSENEDHGIRSHYFMGNRWGNSGNSVRFILGAPKSQQMVIAAMKLKDAYSLEGKLWPTKHIKKQRYYFANRGPSSKVQFSSVTQSCLTHCYPMNRSTPGLPVHHHLLEFTQTRIHRVRDAI